MEIGSIHFSLLAGRILVKDFRYHSSNQTIKIVKGQIQWRYWIRRPTTEAEIASTQGEESKHTDQSLSCRVQISFEGFEWFLYNRTAAYDSIIAQMESTSRPGSRASERRRSTNRLHRQESPFYPPSVIKRSLRIPAPIHRALSWINRQLPHLDPKDLLPLGVELTTGAIIVGNPSTPNLLIAEFHSADGTFGIVPSRSTFDSYKQVLALKFQTVLVRYVQNDEYVDPMATIGALVDGRVTRTSGLRPASSYQAYRSFIRIWRQLGLYDLTNKYFATRRQQHIAHQTIQSSTRGVFRKSKKKLDEDTPIGIDFSTYEYAVERKVLECPVLELSYYVDVVGEVPPLPHHEQFSRSDLIDIGNGDTPPEWGLDLVIHGGFLKYGPWADRQRVELQRAFFPPAYQNAELSPRLKPGDKRMWTALQVFVELRDLTTLHIPFREASKDWIWDGKVPGLQRPRKREHASINVAVGDRSSINYIMPMVAGSAGYEPTLEVHLDTVAITSSLNDIRLVSAESCRVRCELPSPLRWNQERTWDIAVFLRQPVLYLLRDHINMFTDLGKDWTSGPPTDYQKFVPMIYRFKLEMHHYELNLYANDQNIIDKPLLRDENALVVVHGPHLKLEATIPSNTFRPEATTISFTVDANDTNVDISLPRWNTHALHATKEGHSLLKAGKLSVQGSYHYFAEAREEHVEQLKVAVNLQDAAYKAVGWSVRIFMVLRDNYFGSFTHFSTLYEYLDKRKRNLPHGDPIMLKYREGKSNMLQVEVALNAARCTTLVPTSLLGTQAVNFGPQKLLDETTSSGTCLVLAIPEIQLQLRLHDHYMEMSLNLDTVRGYINLNTPGRVTYAPPQLGTKEIILIDGIDVVANRLFGPPPKTSTYVCVWEIQLGSVKASLSASDAILLAAAGNFFRLNFVDIVNAPASEFVHPLDPDITFYKVTVAAIELTWRAGDAALVVSLPEGVKVDSNDLGTHQYKRVISLRAPQICFKVLFMVSSERSTWLEAAEFVADAYADIYLAPKGHHEMTLAQVAFVEEQDKLTGRARRTFGGLGNRFAGSSHITHKNDVFLPQPFLPSRARQLQERHVPRPQQQLRKDRPSTWRLSALSNLSDSEGEEGVSEADRDARLARSRTSNPIYRFGHEGDMTSGDESDDADLTDADSMGSDWSDIADSPIRDANMSLLMYYSQLTRHYIQNRSRAPNLWEGPAFVMSRERAPLTSCTTRTDKERSYDHQLPSTPFSDQLKADRTVTTLRFRTRRKLELRATPLVLPAFICLEEDIKKIPPDAELCIDLLIARYLSRVSSLKNPGELVPCFVVDLALSSTIIHILQHVPMPEEGRVPVARAMEGSNFPTKLDITAVVEVTLEGVGVVGVLADKLLSLQASFQRLSIHLDMSIDKRTLQSTLLDSTILDLSLSNVEVHKSGELLSLAGEISTTIGHRGPEIAAATAIALSTTGSQIVAVLHGSKEQKEATIRNIIHGILKVSESKPVLDPLSTIQPSYLVQSGIPLELRTVPTFRFLYHLRSCVLNLGKAERDLLSVVPNANDTVTKEVLLELLESRLNTLDQDPYNPDHKSALDIFLPSTPTSANGKGHPFVDPPSSISLRIVQTSVIIFDPSGQLPSQFNMTNLHLSIRRDWTELLQFTSNKPTSMSQTSLREKVSRSVMITSAVISLGDVTLTVFPHLMHFAQHILRVRRQHGLGLDNQTSMQDTSSSIRNSKLTNFNLIVGLRHLRVQAAAENLVIVVGVVGLQSSSSSLAQSRSDQSVNSSILFEEVYVQGRSPASPTQESDQDILAAVSVIKGRGNGVSRQELLPSRANLRIVFCIDQLKLNVPRSALRLYRFVEEWRADFLPGIEATVNALLVELNSTKSVSPALPLVSPPRSVLHLHGQLTHFEIALQVMHGTWLSLAANNTIGYTYSSSAPVSGSTHMFGCQVGSIVINVASKPNARDVAPSSRVQLVLPPLSLAGQYDGSRVHALLLAERIELKVKPSHWDTLLAVQQKFGSDFNDLLLLMQKPRLKSSAPSPRKGSGAKLQYGGFVKLKGFRIGLEGMSSTLYLECSDIGGGANSAEGWAWDIGLSGLMLSLAPRPIGRDLVLSGDRRSASITIDFNIQSSSGDHRQVGSLGKALQITITKIHAVMQPSSIGEVGDFIDHLQAEMLEHQEKRAIELAAFKEKAKNILNTFDVKVGDVQLEETTSWISEFLVHITIHNIGVAFPLAHDFDLELPHTGSRDSAAVRAFLFSVKSISFSANRGETGQAIMESLSFQFVSRFRQTFPQDFSAEKHQTRNRLIYPEMRAQLRSTSSATARKVWISANVDGFILDIDSTIPDYVFSLIDVYRQGRERVERLSATIPLLPLSATPIAEGVKPLERHYTALLTSNVFASLMFRSGKVRVYSGSATKQFRSRTLSRTVQELSDEQVLDLGAEVFNLPMVSVWAEYRATPASHKIVFDHEQEPSLLMFKTTVHSSQNTLRPKLLPFITEFVSVMESRMGKISSGTQPELQPTPLISNIISPPRVEESEVMSSMQISFSLRIDQSKLELTCQPDVNVVAGLHWESGGFVLNVAPGARKVSFTGTVGGLTVGLKHGFLSEDCVNLDARNLAFSLAFNKTESAAGESVNFLSVTLDTEFLGGVRFSRLQDILCFKAVWLDRIPVFNNYSPTVSKVNVNPTVDERPKNGFSTAILVRIRQIRLSIDLGKSISTVVLDLNDAVMRTKLTDELYEVFMFVGEVSLSSKGNLAGQARVTTCVFQTIRRLENGAFDNSGHSQMLELRLTSGALIAALESDHHQLLHYRAEPLAVEVFDNWSMTSLEANRDTRPLHLAFTVTSPEVVAVVTVGTFPKLLSYMNKFKANLDAQREGASRESRTYWATRAPKPENPLSAVAEAMLHSARSRYKEAESGLSYVIKQHMSLRLNLLRLVVFPRTMHDVEIAQFIGQDVHARLDRIVTSDNQPAQRDLHLSFSSMTISKYTQVNHLGLVPPDPEHGLDGRAWLQALFKDAVEAIIVGLPSMKMHMVSEETVEELTRNLVYDFNSKFVRREGMRAYEDIYITLNMSLYSWLTVLRKNLTREMDQIRATEDWRTMSAAASSSPGAANQRKKGIPEPLSLTETPRSASTSSTAFSLSPTLAPGSAQYLSIERARTAVSPRDQTPKSTFLSPSQSPIPFPSKVAEEVPTSSGPPKRSGITYKPRDRHIERLTMRQLGEATPDVMHPFFMKKAGFNLEDSLPQYVHEYASGPLEEIMEVLLKLYSQQLLVAAAKGIPNSESL